MERYTVPGSSLHSPFPKLSDVRMTDMNDPPALVPLPRRLLLVRPEEEPTETHSMGHIRAKHLHYHYLFQGHFGGAALFPI